MKKKSSYMALALVCSLFFLNFLYTVNLGAGWNYSYSIETDDEYIYECTTSLYKNGSDDDPYNDHPTKKHQVRVKVIASDLVGGEGSVRYKAWYLPVGSGDWEVLFDETSFEYDPRSVNLGDYSASSEYVPFIDAEVQKLDFEVFFANSPFFVPQSLSQENFTAVQDEIELNFISLYSGVGEGTSEDDVLNKEVENALIVENTGPTNDYTARVEYAEDGLLDRFYIWTQGQSRSNTTMEHVVVDIQKLDYQYDFAAKSNQENKQAEYIIIGVSAAIALAFIIIYRRKTAQ